MRTLVARPLSLYQPNLSLSGRYRTTKEQFHQYLDADKPEGVCQETPPAGDPDGSDPAKPKAKRLRLEDGQENGKTEEAAEPPEQQRQVPKRARGQNKSRPHVKPMHYDKERLCPSLLQVRGGLRVRHRPVISKPSAAVLGHAHGPWLLLGAECCLQELLPAAALASEATLAFLCLLWPMLV